MPAGIRLVSRDKRKTLTPTIEAGRPTHTPAESDEEGSDGGVNEIALTSPGPGQGEEPSHEAERLLGGVTSELNHMKHPKRAAWISILGFSIPRNLALVLLVPLVLALLYIILHSAPRSRIFIPTSSNGTHLFHPTVLLISLDGFRTGYLSSHPHLTVNLNRLANSSHGLKAESMQPCFPSQTFPNHWSIMTGLYPESHGIIANDFWDPVKKRQFIYTRHDLSWDADWWWGEPMWSVAERGGRTSANIMWAGPPITEKGIRPSMFIPFRDMKPSEKLDQMLEWLDRPITSRPQLITTYIPEIDMMGHKGGPGSNLVEQALSSVDEMIGGVLDGLAERNLTDIVNVIVVSDHGMTSTANERLIFLDEVLGQEAYDNIDHRDGWPSVGLRFKEGSPVDEYLKVLLRAADASGGSFAVYTRETMLERWHYNKTERIAPIVMVPKIGWAITDSHEHKVINQGDYNPKGNHGYDNIEPEMQAIFLAHGPFAKALKTSSKSQHSLDKRGWASIDPPILQSFANLEVYSLVMRLMGLEHIEPPHNGTKGFWDQYLL